MFAIAGFQLALRRRLTPSWSIDEVTDSAARRRLGIEVIVVLAATFGLSGLYSVLSLTRSLLSAAALRDQQTTLNASQSTLGWLDAAYQFAHVLQLSAWAVLPLVLLSYTGVGLRDLGLGGFGLRGPGAPADEPRSNTLRGQSGSQASCPREGPWRQLAEGCVLAALIGIPGLLVYLVSVSVGINVQVQASGLGESWWRPLSLVASAAANGAAEEILVVGYLLVRLRQLGWPVVWVIAASSLLRGSYHLYQGFGGGIGNVAMGVVFALWFFKTRRLWPLVVAHTLLDIVAFVGYALLAPHVSWLDSP